MSTSNKQACYLSSGSLDNTYNFNKKSFKICLLLVYVSLARVCGINSTYASSLEYAIHSYTPTFMCVNGENITFV